MVGEDVGVGVGPNTTTPIVNAQLIVCVGVGVEVGVIVFVGVIVCVGVIVWVGV